MALLQPPSVDELTSGHKPMGIVRTGHEDSCPVSLLLVESDGRIVFLQSFHRDVYFSPG